MKLNLNADLGESHGAQRMGHDEALLGSVDSANIACGFHGGDPREMLRTVRLALGRGVELGAHPSFPDLVGFGRRRMQLADEELRSDVIYQVGALQAIARAEGGRVTHVKPHGAMNNMACEDMAMARVIADAVRRCGPELILLAPALSCLAEAGRAAGLRVADEVFADRAYGDDGNLVPRGQPGAVLPDAQACLAQVDAMLAAGGIVARSGKVLKTPLHSICVHGDNAHAVETARAVREGLLARGITLVGLAAAVD